MSAKKPFPWRRLAVCLLFAAVPPLVFAFALSLLPQAKTPLWLLGLSALCGGGIGAWLCFAPKEIRREKGFRLWGGRLCALFCAAILCALGAELFGCNHRAFVTRDCRPVELCPSETALAADENGRCAVVYSDLNLETKALGLSFTGDAKPLSFTVRLRDNASQYADAEANNGLCVPGADGLSAWYGALYSNGSLYRLEVEFSLAQGQSAALASVTLNPNVPVRWQGLRAALFTLGFWLLFCAFRFPWRQVDFAPGKRSHRLAVALPMLCLMAVNLFLSVVSLPKSDAPLRGLFAGQTAAQAAENYSDQYSMLFTAFLQKQVSLPYKADPKLLELNNPYDPSERAEAGATSLWDCVWYNGYFYVYFGPGPVLFGYLPYYCLTGKVPASPQTVAALFGLLAVPLLYLAVIGFLRRYTKRQNLFLLSLSCLAAACVAGIPSMMVTVGVYETVQCLNIAMMAGALACGFFACGRQKPWQRVALFALCGCFFAAQATCRANTLLITTAFLAPAFVGVLRDKSRSLRHRLVDGACFLAPAMLGVGLIMGYNALRFGSAAEFGQSHQLTLEDIHYNVFRLEYIPQALWYFFLDMPAFLSSFPFVETGKRLINVTGNAFLWSGGTGIFTYPMVWALLLLPVRAKERREELRVERTISTLAPLVCAAVLAVVTYFYAGYMQRYTFDFLLAFSLAACLAAMLSWQEDGALAAPQGVALSRLYAVACVLSVGMGLLYPFGHVQRYIAARSPEIYYGLARLFFPN